MIKSGIYQIKNIITNDIYIGSAIYLKSRFSCHRCNLRDKKHYNKKLQNSYNKYGETNFIFTILEYVEDKTKLIEREQFYIDNLKPKYNINLTAGNILGYKHGNEVKKKISKRQIGNKMSDMAKLNMSIAQKGRKHTPASKLKMSLARKGKRLSEDQKKKISYSKMDANDRKYFSKNKG